MKIIPLLILLFTLLVSCTESFQQKLDKKRRDTSGQIKDLGYKFRERYQVDPADESNKIIKEILTFDKDGNIISRAKIGNTREDIISLIEYDLTEEGKIEGYTNYNSGLYTTLKSDTEGKIIESFQRDSLRQIIKTIYFDWEGNTCYQTVYGSNDRLQFADTIIVDDWGNTIKKTGVTSSYTYDENGNPIMTVETSDINSDKIIIKKEFDQHLIQKEFIELPTGKNLLFEYFYSK